jgi:hypothetical protein
MMERIVTDLDKKCGNGLVDRKRHDQCRTPAKLVRVAV